MSHASIGRSVSQAATSIEDAARLIRAEIAARHPELVEGTEEYRNRALLAALAVGFLLHPPRFDQNKDERPRWARRPDLSQRILDQLGIAPPPFMLV